MVIVLHVGILFQNLDALQIKWLWTEGSSSQPECYRICVGFTLFLKMVALLGMLEKPLKVMIPIKYAQANMNMLGQILSKLKFTCLNYINKWHSIRVYICKYIVFTSYSNNKFYRFLQSVN